MNHRKRPRARGTALVSALAWASMLTAVPTAAFAEQFVLFDAMFTYTKSDADNSKPSKSHYYVKGTMLNPERPTDWLNPVDYRNGTIHVRTEVIEKPAGGEVTQWILCYIANQGGYGCAGTGTYREEGLYERDVSMTSWWNNSTIMWRAGIKQMDLVMKDSDGSVGFTHLRSDPEKFFPTTMRITMIQVSAGSKYDPSLVPNLSPGSMVDGGAIFEDAGLTTDVGIGDTESTIGASETDETNDSLATSDTPDGSQEPTRSSSTDEGTPDARTTLDSPRGCSVATNDTVNLANLATIGLSLFITRRRRRAHSAPHP